MASFYEDFSGDLSNWIVSSDAPVDRAWWISSGLLKVEDDVSGKFGLIRYNTPIDVNGQIVVEYNGVDLYNGTDNLVIYRYTDNEHFNFFTIQPGQNDERGIGIGFDSLSQIHPNVELYNSDGLPLSGEVAPNKTIIPVTGKVDFAFTGNTFDVVIYDTASNFVASGTYIDTGNHNINSGYIGFGHDDKWDDNINGWDSINVTDSGAVSIPPTIQSFSATDYHINEGESTTLGWVVTSGTDTTTTIIYPSSTSVSLIGTQVESPTVSTTYGLSAWNVAGSDYEEFIVTVSDVYPIIESFTNDSPISAGTSAILSWVISAGTATSAFIDNGIGWVEPYSDSGSISTPQLYNDITYTITAYDDDLDTSNASTSVDVQQPATGSLSVTGTPVCSGTPFGLVWNTTNATSAYINNGIGAVALDGSMEVSASVPTVYELSAVNHLGVNIYTSNAIVYYRDPIAYAGDDVYVNSSNGSPIPVTLDGSGSYDLDGQGLTYEWYDGGTLLSTSVSFTYDYPIGDHTLILIVMDGCGQANTDTIDVHVTSIIPPTAIANVDNDVLNAPGSVTLDGSNSYDADGAISSYRWYYNNVLIGSTAIITYDILDYGSYEFKLVVTDNDGLTGEDFVSVFVSNEVNPIADAGPDQNFCFSVPTNITMDGSNSIAKYGSSLVWYEYDLASLGLPNIANTITDVNEISATFRVTIPGDYTIPLTVLASNGYDDTDDAIIRASQRPSISATDVYASIPSGQTTTSVQLSAYSDSLDPTYVWIFDNSTYMEQFPNVIATEGTHIVNVHVTDTTTQCRSDTTIINVYVTRESGLSIDDFSVDPSRSIIFNDASTVVELTWHVSNATEVYIDGVGSVNPIAGTVNVTVDFPGGMVPFHITATDGVDQIVETIFGSYTFANIPVGPGDPPESNPIELCKLRADYVKTYGVDELKFGKDRYINLVNYLPEYVRNSDTEVILQEFEDYLNNMYTEQSNYTWEEKELEVSICDTSGCKQWTSCNDIDLCAGACASSGDCNNLASFAVTNQYEFMGATSAGVPIDLAPITPADSVGEVFISNMCGITDDKISILDKIFRLTELFDPDLMPEHLIQNYAENLGYSAGISRESIGVSIQDQEARDIEQRRYLRFMIRNLPNWYQIKSSKPSIKIMLYSFGLIGDFVYYYTKCYSDQLVSDSSNESLCTIIDGNTTSVSDIGDGITEFISPCDMYVDDNDCQRVLANDPDNTTVEEIAKLRACLSQYVSNAQKFQEKINEVNNLTNDDWVLTDVDNSSLQEDLSNIDEDKGYFSTPHFKLWVDILESEGNYSTDENRQRMISNAVAAVKPINTVLDGVAAYWDAGTTMMYCRPISRVRSITYLTIVSDGTYVNPNL